MQEQQSKDSQQKLKSFGSKILTATLICTVILYTNFFIRTLLPDIKRLPPPTEPQVEGPRNYDLGEFIVNLADLKTKKFLKIKLSIAVLDLKTYNAEANIAQTQNINFDILSKETKFRREMGNYKASLSDAIIMTLSSKTSEQLASKDGKELLKDELLNEFNNTLAGSYEVAKVNISEFLVQ